MLRQRVLAITMIALLCSCSDNNISTPNAGGFQPSLVDGARGGNAHFFLLPPLVKQPSYSGTFDATLASYLTVRVCEWSGTVCGRIISTDQAKLEDDHYAVNWKSSVASAGLTYRAQFFVAGTLLGVADLKVVAKGADLKNIDANQFIGVVQGSTLAIKFRVEKGAVTVVTPQSGGTVSSGSVTLQVPAGATSGNVGITIDTVPGSGPVQGVAVELGPTGTQFSSPVTLTFSYDPATVLPQNQGIYWFDPATNAWVLLPGAVVNTTSHTVSVSITHFSKYGHGNRAVDSIAIAPNRVRVGGAAAITATALDANGAPLSQTITLTSANTAVLAVSNDSLHGISAGTAKLYGTAGSFTDSVAVNVYQTLNSVTADSAVVHPAAFGGQSIVKIHALDASGAPILNTASNVAVGSSSVASAVLTNDSILTVTGGAGPATSTSIIVTRTMQDNGITYSKADTIAVQLSAAQSAITASDASGAINASVSLSATVSPAQAGHKVAFSVGGVAVDTATTDASGHASVNYTIGGVSGTRTIGATVVQDSLLLTSSASATLTVLRLPMTVTIPTLTATTLASYNLSAQLSPAAGNVAVDFTVDGVHVASGTSAADGSVNVTVSNPLLYSGNLSVLAQSQQTDTYEAGSGSATIAVARAATSVTASDAAGVVGTDVTLTAVMSPALAGHTISFMAGPNVIGNALTDATGKAAITYHLPVHVGTQPVTASVVQDTLLAASSAQATITLQPMALAVSVDNATGTIDDKISLVAHTTPAAANLTVAFTVNGVAAGNAVTDASGVATLANYSVTAPSGPQTIAVTVAAQGDYDSAGGSGVLNVSGYTTTVTAYNTNANIGAPANLFATIAPAHAGANVQFSIDGNAVGTASTDAGGRAILQYTVVASRGTHSITASVLPDDHFTTATSSAAVLTAYQPETLQMQVLSYPLILTPMTVRVATGHARAGVTVTLNWGNGTGATATTNNYGIAEFTDTLRAPAGGRTFAASIPADNVNYYTAATVSQGVTVLKQSITSFTVDTATLVYGGTFVANAKIAPVGPSPKGIQFLIDGQAVTGAYADSTGTVRITLGPNLTVGGHTLTARFAGDAWYDSARVSSNLAVLPRGVVGVTPTNTTVQTGQQVTFNGQLRVFGTDYNTGWQTIQLYDRATGTSLGAAQTDPSGYFTLHWTPQTAGDHDLYFQWSNPPSRFYYADQTGVTVHATAQATAIDVPAASLSATYHTPAYFNASLSSGGNPLNGKTVSVTIDGATQQVTTANGQISAQYTPSTTGTIAYSIAFAGDAQYAASNASGSITVAPLSTTAQTFYSSNATAVEGQPLNLVAQIGSAFDGAYVDFYDPSHVSYGRAIVTGGSATLTINPGDAKYPPTTKPLQFYASFTGDGVNTISGTTSTYTFGITALVPTLTLQPATADLVAGGVTVTLNGSMQPAIAGKTLTFGTPAGSRAVVVDASGTATTTFNFASAGVFTDTLSYKTLDGQTVKTTSTITINGLPTSITASNVTGNRGQSVTLSANISGVSGSVPLTFILGDQAATGNTDATGHASVSIVPATAGVQTFTVSFAGNSVYAASSTHAVATIIQPVTMTLANTGGTEINSTAILTATLSPALSGQSITFSGKSITSQTVTTDANGQASISVLMTDYNTHQFTASYAGDDINTAASATFSLTATRLITSLSVSDASGTYRGPTIPLVAQMTPALEGRTIDFYIGPNKLGSATTDASGVATYNWQAFGVGPYYFNARFAGDATYLPSQSPNGTVTVGKTIETLGIQLPNPMMQGVTYTLSFTTSPYLVNATLHVTEANSGGAWDVVTNASGVAQLSWTVPVQADAQFTVSFAGNGSVNAATASATQTTTPRQAGTLSLNTVSVDPGQSFTLSATTSADRNGETVSFILNGNSLGNATVVNGVASVTTSLTTPGSYSASATLAGNTVYNPVTATSTVNIRVPTSLSFVDFSGTISSGARKDYLVCMSPALAGKTVHLYMDGSEVAAVATSADGCAYLDETRIYGTGTGHTLSAQFLGDDTAKASSVSAAAEFI